MTSKKVAIITYGCQMNKYDSERIAGILTAQNFALTEDPACADLILLNTCCIREKAEQKVYSELGRLSELKRKKKGLRLGVCGCLAQKEGGAVFQKAPQVDIVCGPRGIGKLPGLIESLDSSSAKVCHLDLEASAPDDFAHLQRKNKYAAWVGIIDGCSNYCTYCVVPSTRGREASRPSSAIIEEIEGLASNGCKEVTLLGQNVNSYGGDLPREINFPGLLRKVSEVEGIERIRFVTSHPRDLSLELIDAICELPKVCKSLHLPVQSGSDKILKLMNRGYTAADYLRKINILKEKLPRIGLSTDIILGFPGETDGDLASTAELLKAVEYGSIFLFKFSPRPNTLARTMREQVPDEVKQRRFDFIIAEQKEIMLRKNQGYVGRLEEVLVEGFSKKDKKKLTGRTDANRIVNFEGDAELIGRIISVEITRAGLYSLLGRLL